MSANTMDSPSAPTGEIAPASGSLLVATDGSPAATEALHAAKALAAHLRAEVRVLTVFEPTPIPAGDPIVSPSSIAQANAFRM